MAANRSPEATPRRSEHRELELPRASDPNAPGPHGHTLYPSEGTQMEVDTIESWDEFDALARDLDGWAFRGQRKACWKLFSSLSRHLQDFVPDRVLWKKREARAIRIFRRKAHNYIDDLRTLDDDLRCLALMQHHGAPTRLLDFTKSPYVAAFFALEAATDDASVYALNTPVLWHKSPTGLPSLTHENVDPRESGNFTKYFTENKFEVVWTGEPRAMDRRLLAQSGTFVVPGVLEKPVEDILRSYQSTDPLIRKSILPAKKIPSEFMRSLYRPKLTGAVASEARGGDQCSAWLGRVPRMLLVILMELMVDLLEK